MQFQLDSETQKVMNTYRLFYKVVFVLWLPILSFIFGIFIFFYMQKNIKHNWDWQTLRSNSIIELEKSFITKYQKFTENSNNSNIENLEIIIKNWKFDATWNKIISLNNLIKFKWLVMPRWSQISTISPLQNKSFFSQPLYNLNDLYFYLEKVIFNIPENISFDEEKRDLIAIPNSDIIWYFSLWCVKSNTSNEICNYYISEFVKNMYIYDLSKDYVWLNLVFQKIKSDKNLRSWFCSSIFNYIQYSKDSSISLQSIFDFCDEKQIEIYNLLWWFFGTEIDLKSQTPTSTIFRQKDINAYKLISLIQIIYYELNKNRFNQPRIAVYLQFVEELIKKDWIDHVYKDLIFLFNNTYLKSILNSPNIASSSSKKEEVKLLQARIREINRWSKLKWYLWLYDQVFNKSLQTLINQEELDENLESDINQNTTMIGRFNTKFNFDNLIIEDISEEWSFLISKWKMLFRDSEKSNRIDVWIVFGEYQWMFVVKKIHFNWYPKINEVLENITKNENMTISKIYAYIQNYSDMLFAENEWQIEFCDIASKIEWLKNCIEWQIDIDAKFSWENVVYSFLHNNWVLEDILNTNKDFEKLLWDEFSWLQTNQNNLIESINMVIARTPEIKQKEIEDETTQTDRFIIESDFELFFWEKTKNIVTREGVVFIFFNVWWIDFVWIYNTQNKTIVDLFFEKLPWYKFSNINIKLEKTNIVQIQQFVENPIEYLRGINSFIIWKYEE